MEKKFTIERLSKDNFDAFIKLFQTVFDSKTNPSFLYEKYDTRYLKGAYQYVGFLAFNDQKEAVSYCGCIPFRMAVQGQQFIAAHSCDHMTRKGARGNGLFTKLNNKTDELVKKLGIPLVFGFPNQNNHPILVKYAAWEIMDTTKVFILPIKTLPLASLAQKNAGLHFLHNKLIQAKLSKRRSSQEYIRHENWQGIIRDTDFYTYKAYSNSYTYDFEYGKVWFKIKGALFIGDIGLKQEADFSPLIKELRYFARSLGVTKIIFISSSNTSLSRSFEKIHKPRAGNAIGMKVMDENFRLDLTQLQFTLGDYDTF